MRLAKASSAKLIKFVMCELYTGIQMLSDQLKLDTHDSQKSNTNFRRNVFHLCGMREMKVNEAGVA